jgi:hypothetical protein
MFSEFARMAQNKVVCVYVKCRMVHAHVCDLKPSNSLAEICSSRHIKPSNATTAPRRASGRSSLGTF